MKLTALAVTATMLLASQLVSAGDFRQATRGGRGEIPGMAEMIAESKRPLQNFWKFPQRIKQSEKKVKATGGDPNNMDDYPPCSVSRTIPSR